jgi:hypothetical protein
VAATLSRACVLAFAAAAGRLGAQYVVVGFSVRWCQRVFVRVTHHVQEREKIKNICDNAFL